MLRIYQAHFSEEIKNTEAQRKFHHSYKEKACTVKVSRSRNAKINLCWNLGWLDTPGLKRDPYSDFCVDDDDLLEEIAQAMSASEEHKLRIQDAWVRRKYGGGRFQVSVVGEDQNSTDDERSRGNNHNKGNNRTTIRELRRIRGISVTAQTRPLRLSQI